MFWELFYDPSFRYLSQEHTTQLLHLATHFGHAEIVEALLHHAAKREDGQMLSFLLKAPGVDLDVADWCGRTPFFMAAQAGSTEFVAAFLDNGADIAAKDRWGATGFFDAVRNVRQEVVRLIF